MRYIVSGLLILLVAGGVVWFSTRLSHIGTPPDPNDPRQAGILTPEVLELDLKGASENLMDRINRGEQISDARFHDLMAEAANSLLNQVDVDSIPPNRAWEYGEFYITARRWKDAKKALDVAVKVAKDEDRRVNDNLRLARVLAELGDVHRAVVTARSTFNVADTGAAPILPATLLEIVPAGAGKGDDAELAAMLEDAIACENRTVVDANTVPGRDFLLARPFHVRNAWTKIVELYTSAGNPAKAKAAVGRMNAMLKQQTGA
ncbi:MAG: hypothetical protein ACHQ50_05675 [Fimbriimonadales bacterium]